VIAGANCAGYRKKLMRGCFDSAACESVPRGAGEGGLVLVGGDDLG
jgi:hypothetical protein